MPTQRVSGKRPTRSLLRRMSTMLCVVSATTLLGGCATQYEVVDPRVEVPTQLLELELPLWKKWSNDLLKDLPNAQTDGGGAPKSTTRSSN